MDMPVTPEAALHLGRSGHEAVHAAVGIPNGCPSSLSVEIL